MGQNTVCSWQDRVTDLATRPDAVLMPYGGEPAELALPDDALPRLAFPGFRGDLG